MSEQNPSVEAKIPPEPVTYKVKGRVANIKIDTKMNSINMETAKTIVKFLKEADSNSKVHVIVIKTAGDKIFSAGFDLRMFKAFSVELKDDLLSIGRSISETIYFLKKPVIAQIQGSAIGMGCIISLTCDFRIAARKENMFFQLPELEINIFPATGPTFNAVNLLGVAHAKEMLLLAKKVSLDEFNSWGMITQIVENPEDLDNVVKKFARKLGEKTPKLLYLTKQAVNIIGKRIAKDSYDLENEMAEHFFAKALGKEQEDIDAFIRKMWDKYGTKMP